jgi:type IV secretion system protein TrbL
VPLAPNTLNDFHNVFDQAIAQGFANIQSDVNWIFNFMCILTIALTAILMWAWEDASSIIRGLIQKMLMIGFIGLVLNNWHNYTLMIVNGFTSLGLKASGSGMSSQTFQNEPSQIFVDGLKLFKKISDSCGCSVLGEPVTLFIYYLCGALVVVAFGWLALGVFIATLEFKIVTLAGMIFIPFAIWPKLSFLSERAFGYVFSFGAKMLTLAVIVSLGEQSIANLTVPTSQTGATGGFDAVFTVCGLSLALSFIAFSSSRLAAALVSGGPQLGAGSAAAFGAGMAGAAAGAAALAGGVVSTATGSVMGRFRAASAAGNMARAANATGGNVSPLAAAAKGALFPSSVRKTPPSGAGTSRTPPGGHGGSGPGGGGAAPKPNPSVGANEAASPPSSSNGDKAPSADDSASAPAAPTTRDATQDTQTRPQASASPQAKADSTPKSQAAASDAAKTASKTESPDNTAPSGEQKNQKRSYTTGGGKQPPLKKITDELRALEGLEATGSLGGPDVHK